MCMYYFNFKKLVYTHVHTSDLSLGTYFFKLKLRLYCVNHRKTYI